MNMYIPLLFSKYIFEQHKHFGTTDTFKFKSRIGFFSYGGLHGFH